MNKDRWISINAYPTITLTKHKPEGIKDTNESISCYKSLFNLCRIVLHATFYTF